MGFDRVLAEKVYDELLSENGGDHGAFTTEQVIEEMLTGDAQQIEIGHNDHGIALHINSERDEAEEEEEEEELQILGNVTNDGYGDDGAGGGSTDCVECPICRMDRAPSAMFGSPCGHNYCRECLERHYRQSVENGIVSFVCMEQQCERAVEESELFLFLDAANQEKYSRFLRNVELAKDPTVRWCVRAGCDTPIKRKSRKQSKLECPECGTAVCFDCAGLYYNDGQNKHECNKQLDEKLVLWAKRSNFDVSFCPKCQARIEKLSGCNHMTCSYCKFEFCWLCRKEFKKGHYDPSNILFGCPGGENADKRPSKCGALCRVMRSCVLMCCLPIRICWWRMHEQGFPWCCCWCCCQD